MLKKLIRISSYALVAFGFTAVQSCGGDDEKKKVECYECTYDGDTYEYCFEDYKDILTRDQFEQFIDLLEDEGYDCKASD